MIIDVHCHYTFTGRVACGGERFSFEPAQAGGAPALDSFISPRKARGNTWRLWQRLLGLPARLRPGPQLDEHIEQMYTRHLLAEGPIERFVLLAFDAYHDAAGRRPPPPDSCRQAGSDIYTSNSLVRAACRARPDRFLFGASVHPYREQAVECVREVFRAGACLLKWLPLHQNIDIRDPRTRAVLRCCAEIGLPLLVHYNEEFTLTTQHAEHRPLAPLLETLRELRREGAMPTVIVAHVATPVTPLRRRGDFHLLLNALGGEFADAPLYADISALATLGKAGFVRLLIQRPDLHGKLLFGTDFPVPPVIWRLKRELRREYRAIASDPSWPQRVARAMRAAGFGEIVFRRAAELLPNVDYFARQPAAQGGTARGAGGPGKESLCTPRA